MDNVICHYGIIVSFIIAGGGVAFALWVLNHKDFYVGCVMSAISVVVGIISHVYARSLELAFAFPVAGGTVSGKYADASVDTVFPLLLVVIMMIFAVIALLLKHQENILEPSRP
jgi:hypothetical protein